MPTPKFRTSASKRDMRRSHDALTEPAKSICPSCSAIRRPHTVCGSCGEYRGRKYSTKAEVNPAKDWASEQNPAN